MQSSKPSPTATSAVVRSIDHIEKVENCVQQSDERYREVDDCIKKENELLRRELTSLKAMVEALHPKETENASVLGKMYRQESSEHASTAATVPRLVSPAGDRHDDRDSHHSFEEDLSTSSCGLKHRKTLLHPQSALPSTSSLMENGKFDMSSHTLDGMEMAPLVGSLVGPGDCNNPTDFLDAVRDRASWLVGLLFLTMLVGAGGNGGNQSSVQVIRGLATGKMGSWKNMLWRELGMGVSLATVLGIAGAVRAALFATPLLETVAITMSLGAALPLLMQLCGVDPAHSSTTIQVLMDILGVTITVQVCSFILDSALGAQLSTYFTYP